MTLEEELKEKVVEEKEKKQTKAERGVGGRAAGGGANQGNTWRRRRRKGKRGRGVTHENRTKGKVLPPFLIMRKDAFVMHNKE